MAIKNRALTYTEDDYIRLFRVISPEGNFPRHIVLRVGIQAVLYLKHRDSFEFYLKAVMTADNAWLTPSFYKEAMHCFHDPLNYLPLHMSSSCYLVQCIVRWRLEIGK